MSMSKARPPASLCSTAPSTRVSWKARLRAFARRRAACISTSPLRGQTRNDAGKQRALDIDFRGDGGYVIVPPSVAVVQSGVAAYRPFSLSSAPAQPIDAAALREFLDPRPVRQERAAAGPVSGEVLAVWMARLREGERNHGLFWAACRLSESGVIAEAIVEVLGPAAERIGLDAQEVERTVSSACRHTHSARRDGTAPRATNHTPPSASCSEPRRLR